MARFEATVTSPETREAVFDYLADFRSVAEWDPSIRSARLARGQAGVPGAEFELIVRFLGRDVSMTYRGEVVDRPRRLLMVAETATVVFSRISERARIGLEARLIGPLHPRRDREAAAT